MIYHTALAFKGTFDASFPDMKKVREDADAIPGRSLGELIAQGLIQRGLQASGPLNEEPFFVVPCRSGEYDYRVLCYVLEPGADPVWIVECPRVLGTIARWRGKSEENELGAVVVGIHETLKNDSRVREMRWFAELPSVPFDESEYATAPVTAS